MSKSKVEVQVQRQARLLGVAALVLALGGILGAIYWAYSVLAASAEVRRQAAELQADNTQLGLPLDFPSDVVPLYEGATITAKSRGETKSTSGAPMDQWKMHAETETDKDVVYQFYEEHFLGRGMSQTLYASVPNGYGVTYADEQMEIQVTVEKKRNDKLTQIDFIISRLR